MASHSLLYCLNREGNFKIGQMELQTPPHVIIWIAVCNTKQFITEWCLLVRSLSEFEAMVQDLKGTLEDILEFDDYMAEMYLSHLVQNKWVWL